jgi:hypothetical protein
MINSVALRQRLYGFFKTIKIIMFIVICSFFAEVNKFICNKNICMIFMLSCEAYIMIPMVLTMKF